MDRKEYDERLKDILIYCVCHRDYQYPETIADIHTLNAEAVEEDRKERDRTTIVGCVIAGQNQAKQELREVIG